MINTNDSLQFRNVISTVLKGYYEDLTQAIQTFIDDVTTNGGVIKPYYFYSLNDMNSDGEVLVEVFLPLEDVLISRSRKYDTHSYFSIDNVISMSIIGDVTTQTEYTYAVLMTYLEENNLRQASPYFHVVSSEKPYIEVKIGVTEKPVDDGWL